MSSIQTVGDLREALEELDDDEQLNVTGAYGSSGTIQSVRSSDESDESVGDAAVLKTDLMTG